jgi:hypothetical protein
MIESNANSKNSKNKTRTERGKGDVQAAAAVEGRDSIRPQHLREANRRLRLAGKIPNGSRYQERLFP